MPIHLVAAFSWITSYVGMSGPQRQAKTRGQSETARRSFFLSSPSPIPHSTPKKKRPLCCYSSPHSPVTVLDKRHVPLLPSLALDRGLGLRFVIFWLFLPIFGPSQVARPAAESVSPLVLLLVLLLTPLDLS